jgi:4-carboxymuconolactone decarboxylase
MRRLHPERKAMRLTPIPPPELSEEQRPCYDDMKAVIEKHFTGFKAIREDGALIGPWTPWLRWPQYGRPIWDLVKALSLAPTLPPAMREIAILVTGAKFHAAYQIYAHVVGAEQRGLPDGKIATIVAGQRPPDLSRDEGIVYDLVSALIAGSVLPELTYRQVHDRFGGAATAELIYLVGLYCLVAVTLNAYDVPLHE